MKQLRSSAIATAFWLLTGLGLLMLGPVPAHDHAGHAADTTEMHDAGPLDMVPLATSVDQLMLQGFAMANLSRSEQSGAPCAGACCAGLQCCAVAPAADIAGLLAPSATRERHTRRPYDWASRHRKALPEPPRLPA